MERQMEKQYALDALKKIGEEKTTEGKNIEEGLKKVNERQKYFADNLGSLRKEAFNLIYKSLNNIDKWTFSIITLSSAIFGFTISSMLGKNYISCAAFLYLGIILFVFNVVWGMWLLKEQFKNDYMGMREQHAIFNKLIYTFAQEARHEIRQSEGDIQLIEEIHDKLGAKQAEIVETLKEKHKDDYCVSKAPNIMFYVFLSGIVAVLFSLLPWDFIINKMHMLIDMIMGA